MKNRILAVGGAVLAVLAVLLLMSAPVAPAYGRPSYHPYVRLTWPRPGQQIRGSFTVIGETVPRATVVVHGRLIGPPLPTDEIEVENQSATVTTTADAFGRFSVPMRVGVAPIGSIVELTVTAYDYAGRASPPRTYDIATAP